MSQNDLVIADQAGAAFRADVNSALQALGTLQSGATAPATTYAYMYWADTTTNTLKQRNAANSAWIIRGTLDESFVLSRSSNTILDISDRGKVLIATASFTQTLDAAATLTDGWSIDIVVDSGVTLVIDPNASETVDGATTKSITGPVQGKLVCNGTLFRTIGMSSNNYPARNVIINDSGAVNQEADSTAKADGTYGHDQWYRLTQSNAIAVSDVANAENTTPHMMRLTQSNVTAQRMGYAQVIEGSRCRHLRGQTVSFKFGRVRLSSSANIRMAVLEWTGTEDAPTKDVVNDWTSSTYTAGNFFNSTTLTVSGVVQQALTANTLTDGSTLTVTLGSSFTNLIVFVWTESTVAQNVTLDLAKALLSDGGTYAPLPVEVQLQAAQRYYRRRKATAANQLACSGSGYVTNTQQVFADHFPVPMRSAPTFSISAAGDFQILVNSAAVAATGLTLTAADAQGALLQTANTSFGATAGAMLVSANSSAWMDFNARI